MTDPRPDPHSPLSSLSVVTSLHCRSISPWRGFSASTSLRAAGHVVFGVVGAYSWKISLDGPLPSTCFSLTDDGASLWRFPSHDPQLPAGPCPCSIFLFPHHFVPCHESLFPHKFFFWVLECVPLLSLSFQYLAALIIQAFP